MAEQQFFNPLTDDESSEIIDYIQNNNIACTIRIYDNYINTQFLKNQMMNIAVYKKNTFAITSEKIIVTFESVGDQFFFESVASSEESSLIISLPEKIFKLQRRNDFRVAIPSSIRPVIKLRNYPELKTEIRDMSLGGCKIALRTEFKLDLNLNQECTIEIKVLDFDEKNLPVVIKFIDFVQENKTTLIGLQFVSFNSEQTALMRNTLLQIDRLLRHKTQD